MKKEYVKLKKLIERSNNILILTHRGPDFDAFSSALILKNFINTYYPKKFVEFKSRQYPTQKMPFMDQIQIVQKIDAGNEDLVIMTDASGWDICITKDDTIQLTKAKVAIIDHHSTKGINAEVILNSSMSSATEQVLDFCIQVKGKKYIISKEISELGQVGIVFDTGRFIFDNTKPETYELMAKLRRVYEFDLEDFEYKSEKFPSESLLPLKIYIQNIHIINDMAYSYINLSDVKTFNLSKIGVNSAQEFVRDHIVRYIQGVHWGFVVKPSFTNENEWKVSFRSSKGYQEVAGIAEAFNGGGHQYSAAARVTANEGELAAKLILDTINRLQNPTVTSSVPSPAPQPST